MDKGDRPDSRQRTNDVMMGESLKRGRVAGYNRSRTDSVFGLVWASGRRKTMGSKGNWKRRAESLLFHLSSNRKEKEKERKKARRVMDGFVSEYLIIVRAPAHPSSGCRSVGGGYEYYLQVIAYLCTCVNKYVLAVTILLLSVCSDNNQRRVFAVD